MTSAVTETFRAKDVRNPECLASYQGLRPRGTCEQMNAFVSNGKGAYDVPERPGAASAHSCLPSLRTWAIEVSG